MRTDAGHISLGFQSANPITFNIKNFVLSSLRDNLFDGQAIWDPWDHLDKIYETCSICKPKEVTEDQIQLHLFSFSLISHAKEWLQCIPNDTIQASKQLDNFFREVLLKWSFCGEESCNFKFWPSMSLSHCHICEKGSSYYSISVWIIIWILWNKWHTLSACWKHQWECFSMPHLEVHWHQRQTVRSRRWLKIYARISIAQVIERWRKKVFLQLIQTWNCHLKW